MDSLVDWLTGKLGIVYIKWCTYLSSLGSPKLLVHTLVLQNYLVIHLNLHRADFGAVAVQGACDNGSFMLSVLRGCFSEWVFRLDRGFRDLWTTTMAVLGVRLNL